MARGRWLGIGLLGSTFLGVQANACTVGRQNWFLGQDVTYRTIVKPGESCGHTFSLGGGAERISPSFSGRDPARRACPA